MLLLVRFSYMCIDLVLAALATYSIPHLEYCIDFFPFWQPNPLLQDPLLWIPGPRAQVSFGWGPETKDDFGSLEPCVPGV